MKQFLATLTLLLFAGSLAANSYSSNFSVTENPISENSKWVNGKVMAGIGERSHNAGASLRHTDWQGDL